MSYHKRIRLSLPPRQMKYWHEITSHTFIYQHLSSHCTFSKMNIDSLNLLTCSLQNDVIGFIAVCLFALSGTIYTSYGEYLNNIGVIPNKDIKPGYGIVDKLAWSRIICWGANINKLFWILIVCWMYDQKPLDNLPNIHTDKIVDIWMYALVSIVPPLLYYCQDIYREYTRFVMDVPAPDVDLLFSIAKLVFTSALCHIIIQPQTYIQAFAIVLLIVAFVIAPKDTDAVTQEPFKIETTYYPLGYDEPMYRRMTRARTSQLVRKPPTSVVVQYLPKFNTNDIIRNVVIGALMSSVAGVCLRYGYTSSAVHMNWVQSGFNMYVFSCTIGYFDLFVRRGIVWSQIAAIVFNPRVWPYMLTNAIDGFTTGIIVCKVNNFYKDLSSLCESLLVCFIFYFIFQKNMSWFRFWIAAIICFIASDLYKPTLLFI